ncbi:Putative mycotoxin biosynthesis protein UstYa [Septoria linicola]|uniref:Mycotoxin biosynthesis protein UstYa n=1 Tax=Septoria linicola TaxID=215465 RepID=A0A9Q9AZA4_9PEZI|nr:Putative mycotoxin biosynthesis protein UstYa [Septoria linicola]
MAVDEYQDEEKPFLVSIQEKHDEVLHSKRRPSWSRTHHVLFVLHAIFLTANAGLLAFSISSSRTRQSICHISAGDAEELYSPAQAIIQHEIRIPNVSPGGPFTGLPRRELDEAWSDLLVPSMVDMPAAEMSKMNKSSIAVRGTGGYVGYYGVFHQLHCLKRIYQWNYRDHYPDLIAARRLTEEHYDHCIEVVRQALICQPDLTVNTVHFDPEAPTGIKGVNQHERRCVKWDAFKEFADSRAIPAPLEAYVVEEDEEGSFGP